MYQNVQTCILEVNSTRVGIKLPLDIVYCGRQWFPNFSDRGPVPSMRTILLQGKSMCQI